MGVGQGLTSVTAWATKATIASLRRARLQLVESPVPATIPTAERPELSDKERADRLALLAERLRSTDGLDHDTLEKIEQLTAAEQ